MRENSNNGALSQRGERLVSVAILTFNREAQVLRAIESVERQEYCGFKFEIVVLDNASTDGTVKAIKDRFPDVVVLRAHRNLGCPAGRNFLYANCNGEFIVNVDDDGECGAGLLQGAIDLLATDQNIGIVGFRRVEFDSPMEPAQQMNLTEVASFSGGLSAMRSEVFRRAGYYPDDYFLLGEEEYLALRVLETGYRIVYAPHLTMKHAAEANTRNVKWDYFRYRNPLLNVVALFPRRSLPLFLGARLARYFLDALRRGSVLQFLRAVWFVACNCVSRERTPVSGGTIRRYRRMRQT